MRSPVEIGNRIAAAKDELSAITNPVAKRADGSIYFPDPAPNDAIKAENDKKVIALTAEFNALCWAQEGPFLVFDESKQAQGSETVLVPKAAEPGSGAEPLPKIE